MGVPPVSNVSVGTNINAIPFAAYQAIYNEYYRDQNLIPEVDYKLIDGDNGVTWALRDKWTKMRNRAWEHDYFTSSLPFAQKGAAVDIPIGQIEDNVPVNVYRANDVTLTGAPINITVDGVNVNQPNIPPDTLWAETEGLDVGATTINDLRRAFRLQEWLEKNARGGTRYIENILATPRIYYRSENTSSN
jgi:hypothetical protein